jgi:hypothetical protein
LLESGELILEGFIGRKHTVLSGIDCAEASVEGVLGDIDTDDLFEDSHRKTPYVMI